MANLHLRPMIPDEPEMVPEDEIEYVQLYDDKGKALEEWFHFDPVTRRAVKGPKPKASKKLIPTGSMMHRDFVCKDCGTPLQNGQGNVRFMVCGRLNPADPTEIKVPENDERGRPSSRIDKVHAPEPKADTVIECGRYGLEGEN